MSHKRKPHIPRIGTVTIGQSPRDDVVPELQELVVTPRKDIEIMEKGALDDLTLFEVKGLVPQPDDETLVTRMRDGTEVTIGKCSIVARMQEKIAELNDEDVDLITLLCSGTFPEFESKAPLLYPHKLLYGTLSSVVIPGKLGLLVPSKDQLNQISREIEDLGFQVIGAGASPYLNDEKIIKEAAQKINKDDVDLILMNCFGYTMEMRKLVKKITGKPIILVRSLLAKALSELIQ